MEPTLIITALATAIAGMATTWYREMRADIRRANDAIEAQRNAHKEERDEWRKAVLDHLNRGNKS